MATVLPSTPTRKNAAVPAARNGGDGPAGSASPRPAVGTTLTLKRISPEAHLAAVAERGSSSFLQMPSWGEVKSYAWERESLGWFDGHGTLVGTALVLYRQLPKIGRRFAYLPEGPDIDWVDPDLSRWLEPLTGYFRSKNVFAVRMGPHLTYRSWSAETVKDGVRRGATRLDQVVPDLFDPVGTTTAARLKECGWRSAADDGEAQPRFVFEVPLAGRTADDLWKGFNQEWRRSVRKAEKAGVKTRIGGYEDLPVFYDLLKQTEERDGFKLGRSLSYYQSQYKLQNEEQPGMFKLYLAEHDGEVLAAHTMITVGDRVWYQSGASANHRREVRPSHMLEWRMLQDAIDIGAAVYDMRGVSPFIIEGDPRFGVLRFKLGTGGSAVERLGEWDLPLNSVLYKAFRAYRARR